MATDLIPRACFSAYLLCLMCMVNGLLVLLCLLQESIQRAPLVIGHHSKQHEALLFHWLYWVFASMCLRTWYQRILGRGHTSFGDARTCVSLGPEAHPWEGFGKSSSHAHFEFPDKTWCLLRQEPVFNLEDFYWPYFSLWICIKLFDSSKQAFEDLVQNKLYRG